MKKEKKFLLELYSVRIDQIPFIEYFQNDRYLRKELFILIKEKHDFYKHHFHEINAFKILKEIKNAIGDFEESALSEVSNNAAETVNIFATNIIGKLEQIGIPKLKKQFLKDFTKNQQNIHIIANDVVDQILGQTIKIDYNTAQSNYRKIKSVADVYISNYLDKQEKQELDILSKFKSIGYLDHKKLNNELRLFESIDQKLDYLKTIKENFYDKYFLIKDALTAEDSIYYLHNKGVFLESVFSNYSFKSPLRIQTPVFDFHFADSLDNPQLTYWFLKFNAQELFEHMISSTLFKNKINSQLKNTLINSELLALDSEAEKATDLLLKKELDIHSNHKNNYKYQDEVALLRVLDGNYFENNSTASITNSGAPEIQAYLKHILLKPYYIKLLENKIVEKQKPEPIEITNEIIQSLRLAWGTTNLIFDDNTESLNIPEKMVHEHLLRNFIVNQNILKFYYAPMSDLMSDEEFAEKVNTGYKGSRESLLSPYSVAIYGAYYCRKDLFYKLSSIINSEQKNQLNGVTIKYFNDLIPYFIDYSSGFKNGFCDFEKDHIDLYLNKFSDKNDFANKVFEYLTKHLIFYHSWINNHSSFTFSINIENRNEREIIDGYENGKKQGYFYKAWAIVFSNNALYAPLFDNYYLPDLEIEEVKNHDTNSFVNNLDSTPEEIVNDYFYKSLVAKNYLSNEELDIYLKQAFDDKTLSGPKFSFTNEPARKVMIKIFYLYYKDIAGKPYGRINDYIRLLGDYFVGFDSQKLRTNFSRYY